MLPPKVFCQFWGILPNPKVTFAEQGHKKTRQHLFTLGDLLCLLYVTHQQLATSPELGFKRALSSGSAQNTFTINQPSQSQITSFTWRFSPSGAIQQSAVMKIFDQNKIFIFYSTQARGQKASLAWLHPAQEPHIPDTGKRAAQGGATGANTHLHHWWGRYSEMS